MHKDERCPVAGGDAGDFGVETQPAYVVDDARPCPNGRLGHVAFGGVNGERDIRESARERANDGQNSAEFFLGGNGARPGAGGLASNVNPIRALSRELEAAPDRARSSKVEPAVRER